MCIPLCTIKISASMPIFLFLSDIYNVKEGGVDSISEKQYNINVPTEINIFKVQIQGVDKWLMIWYNVYVGVNRRCE